MGLLTLDKYNHDDRVRISPVVLKLIQMIDDPKTKRSDVAKWISLDEVLSTNAFKYANSAFVGALRKLSSLDEIVNLLGFNVIKSMAILSSLRAVVIDKQEWFNTIFMAVAAKNIAAKSGYSHLACEDIYLAALLHNYTKSFNNADDIASALGDYALPENIIDILIAQNGKQEDFGKINVVIALAEILLGLQNVSETDSVTIQANIEYSHLKTLFGKQYFDYTFIDQDFLHNIWGQTKELTSL